MLTKFADQVGVQFAKAITDFGTTLKKPDAIPSTLIGYNAGDPMSMASALAFANYESGVTPAVIPLQIGFDGAACTWLNIVYWPCLLFNYNVCLRGKPKDGETQAEFSRYHPLKLGGIHGMVVQMYTQALRDRYSGTGLAPAEAEEVYSKLVKLFIHVATFALTVASIDDWVSFYRSCVGDYRELYHQLEIARHNSQVTEPLARAKFAAELNCHRLPSKEDESTYVSAARRESGIGIHKALAAKGQNQQGFRAANRGPKKKPPPKIRHDGMTKPDVRMATCRRCKSLVVPGTFSEHNKSCTGQ
jgi:hypothetical protein